MPGITLLIVVALTINNIQPKPMMVDDTKVNALTEDIFNGLDEKGTDTLIEDIFNGSDEEGTDTLIENIFNGLDEEGTALTNTPIDRSDKEIPLPPSMESDTLQLKNGIAKLALREAAIITYLRNWGVLKNNEKNV